MPTLSGSTGNIRGAPPPDIRSSREPSDVMSELVAEFFRSSACSSEALLCRSVAHARSDSQEDYASIQGDHLRTAPIRGVSCIVDSVVNERVECNLTAGAIKHADDRQMIARGTDNLNVVAHSACPNVLRLSADSRPKRAVAFKRRPSLSVVQEPDGTMESNGDALCSD
jgi:hypothetical protein